MNAKWITSWLLGAFYLSCAGCHSSGGMDKGDASHPDERHVGQEQQGEAGSDDATDDDLVHRAYELAATGESKRALALVDRVLRSRPNHREAGLARVRILLQSGRAQDARGECKRLLEADPEDAATRILLGFCHLDLDLVGKAEEAFRMVIAGESSDREKISAWLALAAINEKRGDTEQANQCYEKAIAIDESVADLLLAVERQSFFPAAITDPERQSGSRSSISPGEVERIVRDVERDKR